jgi:hypothetical protein
VVLRQVPGSSPASRWEAVFARRKKVLPRRYAQPQQLRSANFATIGI